MPASGSLRDQMLRSSESIVLNIAEGAGEWLRPAKRRYFTIARGSTFEIGSAIDLVRLRAPAAACDDVVARLGEVERMLTALVWR